MEITEEVLLRYEDPGEFLISELQEVYDNASRNGCDVDVYCKDGAVVKIHSAMLAVVSPYLKLVLADVWDPHHGAAIVLPDFV